MSPAFEEGRSATDSRSAPKSAEVPLSVGGAGSRPAPAFDVVGIGLNATDTLILLDEFPEYAGKVPFSREFLSPGGQVATAIVTCARLGLRSKYIGTVGDDMRGDIQRQSLEGTGVDTSSVIVRRGCANQTAYILIDHRTGERTVLWQRPSGLRLTPSDLNVDDVTSSRLLHTDGYDTDAIAWAAALARQHGIPVSLDVDTVYPGFEKVLRNTDYLVASSTWPRRWTGQRDVFDALRSLQREYGFAAAAMTLGSEGALALYRGEWSYSPAFDVKCVDTTGAGDVFHGAFCVGMLNGMCMGQVLDFANAAAAINCTALGARGHIPNAVEVQKLRDAGLARHVSTEIMLRLEGENNSQ